MVIWDCLFRLKRKQILNFQNSFTTNAENMNMKNIFLLLPSLLLPLLLSLFIGGCFKLDGFLLRGDEIEEYKLGSADENIAELSELNKSYPDSSIVYEEVNFKSGKDTLYGFYLTHPTNTNHNVKAILYNHGNSTHLDKYWTRAKLLYQTGLNVFIYDYSGFGKSTGDSGIEKLSLNAQSAVEWLMDKKIEKSNIIVYGYSIGSVPSIDIIHLEKNKSEYHSLILEDPVASLDALTQEAMGIPVPSRYFFNSDVNNKKKIANITLPLFWIHGKKDKTLNWKAQGEAVYISHPSPKYKHLSENAEHTDLPKVIGYEKYLSLMKEFMMNKSID